MTWIRWDTATPQSDVVGWLAERLKLPLAQALGHYVAACCGFGDHRQDGDTGAISDELLEQWAMWRGRPGRFAAAFRERCADTDGILRGWWRQEKLFAKATRDRSKRKPAKNPQETRDEPPGLRTDVRTERTTTPTPPAVPGFVELVNRLPTTGGIRWAITEFLEAAPHGKTGAWVPILTNCLAGMDMPGGQPCTPDQLATTCRDFMTKQPHEWTPKFFRTCVAALMRQPAGKTASGATERTIQAAEAFAEGA